MANQRSDARSFSVQQLLAITDAECTEKEINLSISGVEDLRYASENDISLFVNPRYKQDLQKTKAAAVILKPEFSHLNPSLSLTTDNPLEAFEKIIQLFHQDRKPKTDFIHPSAIIHPSVHLGDNITIEPYVVVEEGAFIGKNSRIGAYSYIGENAHIGSDCTLQPRVTIQKNSYLNDHIFIDSGTVIGSIGFGFKTDHQGNHKRLTHFGRVVIESDVEIGSNVVIDSARFTETRILQGTKIDKLVAIGHNCEIGPHNIIVAQAGIAGSTMTGKYVIIGGQVGVSDHLRLADHSRFAAKSGVSKSTVTGGDYNGIPAMPVKEYNRMTASLRKIEVLKARIKKLEQAL